MLFAKGIASDAGSKSIPPAVNATFRIAMALFQGMALQGVGYVTDPTTPYGSTLGNAQAIDYLQFPVQTLAYRAGDCDDLSILYCALLEAAGIRSAFITVPGHIYAAFELGMRPEDARATFSNPKSLIFRDNETWVPVEITLVRKGFTEAWRSGAVDWQTNHAKNAASFLVIRDAWQEYRPVSSSRVMKDGVRLPDSASVFQAYTAELNRYLGIDLKPRVAELQAALRTNRTSTRLLNKLGVLYARFGLLTDARVQFEAAARVAGPDAPVSVLVNLGNISYLNGSFKDAAEYYNSALSKNPGAPGALRGLALSSYELGDTKTVDSTLAQLRTADPESADKLMALGSGTSAGTGARAASADREVNTWSDE
jgi:tetratricopeptide (TPR) repeat protein